MIIIHTIYVYSYPSFYCHRLMWPLFLFKIYIDNMNDYQQNESKLHAKMLNHLKNALICCLLATAIQKEIKL